MNYEIFKTVAFVLLYVFTTYAIAKAFWIFGWRGKVASLSKFWGALSLLIGGLAAAFGLLFLILSLNF